MPLHTLHLRLPDRAELARSGLRALHSLAQLRDLALLDGTLAADVADVDVAALVRALRHLRAFTLDTCGGKLSDTVLHDAGAAGPQLRWLHLPVDCCLKQTLTRAPANAVLFPQLEELGVILVPAGPALSVLVGKRSDRWFLTVIPLSPFPKY